MYPILDICEDSINKLVQNIPELFFFYKTILLLGHSVELYINSHISNLNHFLIC